MILIQHNGDGSGVQPRLRGGRRERNVSSPFSNSVHLNFVVMWNCTQIQCMCEALWSIRTGGREALQIQFLLFWCKIIFCLGQRPWGCCSVSSIVRTSATDHPKLHEFTWQYCKSWASWKAARLAVELCTTNAFSGIVLFNWYKYHLF